MKAKKRKEMLEWRRANFDAMCEQLRKTAAGATVVEKRAVTRPGSFKK